MQKYKRKQYSWGEQRVDVKGMWSALITGAQILPCQDGNKQKGKDSYALFHYVFA